MSEGVEGPKTAISLVQTLIKKGISPEISRTIIYDTSSGHIIKESEFEDLTSDRLEDLAENGEQLPEFEKSIVQSFY